MWGDANCDLPCSVLIRTHLLRQNANAYTVQQRYAGACNLVGVNWLPLVRAVLRALRNPLLIGPISCTTFMALALWEWWEWMRMVHRKSWSSSPHMQAWSNCGYAVVTALHSSPTLAMAVQHCKCIFTKGDPSICMCKHNQFTCMSIVFLVETTLLVPMLTSDHLYVKPPPACLCQSSIGDLEGQILPDANSFQPNVLAPLSPRVSCYAMEWVPSCGPPLVQCQSHRGGVVAPFWIVALRIQMWTLDTCWGLPDWGPLPLH